ncbi:hypothetical protein VaNZ11_014325 [Volvox africanus]|uniref:Kinesin motor domain-containing protein n=1 Tax=Volvox africanus TaxID=51714 RepID=A0ABQ5SIY4_9CHLO|nr:hypothetical protein VaNZ11_014325 [Volvox africanus]
MAEIMQPAEESNVCVAVKIRPLVASEIDEGCRESLFVTPGCPQVSTGQHTFTYDHVFGEGGTAPDQLYARCIAPLVDGLVKGYNATVFAYGQTGSGKTFTMGSEYRPGARCRGVIPDTINDIFNRIDAAKDRAITVRVSFVEIHKEEVKDLLLPACNGPRPAVTIRETPNGDVALYGAVEKEVRSREEMAEVLELGTLCRSTASTSMNNRSSRSHAIFTITMEQRRQVQQAAAQGEQVIDDDGDDEDDAPGEEVEGVEDFLGAKMHLVDLAGSERAKRTKAEGARLREGIHINRGLLALGNVINAIVDNHKHVPYRDSKLTRLLQDSLGGNSRTVMIACVSPADSNFEESLNTLRYADRARHIRNKPVVNRDPVAAQLAVLRNTIAQLKSENVSLKRALAASGNDGTLDTVGTSGLGNSALESLVDRLTQENNILESDNMRLKMDLDELRRELAAITDKWHTAQAQCDLLRMNQAAAAGGMQHRQGGLYAIDGTELPLPGLDIVKGYVARIAELEAEVKSMKSLAVHFPFTRRRSHGLEARTPGSILEAEDLDPASPAPPSMLDGVNAMDGTGGEGDGDDDPTFHQHSELAVEEEEIFMAELAAHTLSQEKMKKEVTLLQRQLEAKERKMVELMKNAGSMPALKQHYDRVLADLEAQRDTLVAERKALMEKLNAVSAANEEERKRLEATYVEKIHQYDERLRELRRKEREFIAMQKLKQRTEDAHRRLSADITRLKQQKVAVQKQLEANAKQFAHWRNERERELGQLRKQSRKDRAQIQHLQAMAAKQTAVLQRKISDATAARKRIKELEEEKRRKAAAAASQQHPTSVLPSQQAVGGNIEIQPNGQAPVLRTDKERREWLQKELEMCNMSCEFRKVIDGELAQRAEATRKLKDLEKRLTHLDQLHPASPLLMTGVVTASIPVSPNTASSGATLSGSAASDPEYREKLLARKKELEEKVAYHNEQITELQADWERQKTEEESRGGGALDIRRWAGLRTVSDCRELLRTLFRMSIESKTLSNELTVDMVRYMEEVDVLRVQLDGAQKKCAQYRKLAISLQAAAALVASAPPHSSMSTQDETDKQVDAVLEALHVVRNNTPPGVAGGVSKGVGTAGIEADGPPGMDNMETQEAGSPGTPGASQNGPAKALEFLSPVPSGAQRRLASYEAASRAELQYLPERIGDSDNGNDARGHIANKGGRLARESSRHDNQKPDDMEVDEGSRTESGSDDDSSDDGMEESDRDSEGDSDRDDRDWDPKNATPAVRGRNTRAGRRSSATMGGGCGGSSRRSCSRQSPVDSEPSTDGDSTEGLAHKGRRSSKCTGARRATSSRHNSNIPDDAASALEAPVLDDINLKRMANGGNNVLRLQKLTVAVLKEALKGMVIDGQKWTAGSKTRAMMIQDYRRMLGLDKVPSQLSSHSSDPVVNGNNGGSQDIDAVAARLNRMDNSVGGGGEISVGGAKDVEMPLAESFAKDPADEGFTFSPHLPTAPVMTSSSSSEVPSIASVRPASPCQTPSGRRISTGNAMGPWARSSLLTQAHSSRHYTTWASSLRSSCTLPTTDPASSAGDVATGPGPSPALVRSGSGVISGSVVRGASSTSLPAGAAADPGAPSATTSRRHTAWGPTLNCQSSAGQGLQHQPLSYRGAVLSSPQQNPSPQLARPPGPVSLGGFSPSSSMSSPTPRSAPRPTGKAGGSRMCSPGMSPEPRERGFGYTGGENMQPDATTPRGITASASSEGKITSLSNLYKAKAAVTRERKVALLVSMQKNWEHQEAPHSRGVGLTANVRTSINGPVGTTGTVTSSIDGALRAGPGLRDSTGSGLGVTKQQKAIWR